MCEARPAARVTSASPLALSSAPSSCRVAASVSSAPSFTTRKTIRASSARWMHERFHESDSMATIPVTTPLLRRSSTDTAPTELPLLDWIKPERARVTPVRRGSDGERMPARAPDPGEQYRFHVDMGACIGCKCSGVACNEQNGNPAPINWRRVGEIEGGWFPSTSRSYLSMGCHHCLEPTCLQGCPVDAYTKDSITGIVRHSADACIGCQYCTWNCSYGVPQYNPERGVVGKCDMCHGRLSLGQSPACVSACPEGALAIEIVNVAEWRDSVESNAATLGLPIDDGSLSTTR